ncbi:MAG: hypothetical protein HZB25_04840 [Candidatus Eisenbacteria bacterium]|nr:hypothetical protein [Candidatus Eisenbacteria bacterium]
MALLPLENLTPKVDAGDVFTRILFVELTRSGLCQTVEPGEVEAALSELGIRGTGAVSHAQARELAGKLKVRYLLLGSVLEQGTVRRSDMELPAVGVALKLLDADSSRVAWASMGFRTGEDRETVFGWGREMDVQRLSAGLAASLVEELRKFTGTANAVRKGGSRK